MELQLKESWVKYNGMKQTKSKLKNLLQYTKNNIDKGISLLVR